MSTANPVTPEPRHFSIRLTYSQCVWLVTVALLLAIFLPCTASVISQILDLSDGGFRSAPITENAIIELHRHIPNVSIETKHDEDPVNPPEPDPDATSESN